MSNRSARSPDRRGNGTATAPGAAGQNQNPLASASASFDESSDAVPPDESPPEPPSPWWQPSPDRGAWSSDPWSWSDRWSGSVVVVVESPSVVDGESWAAAHVAPPTTSAPATAPAAAMCLGLNAITAPFARERGAQ